MGGFMLSLVGDAWLNVGPELGFPVSKVLNRVPQRTVELKYLLLHFTLFSVCWKPCLTTQTNQDLP